MLARTPPEFVTDRFEQRALEMVDVIRSQWPSEDLRLWAASYIACSLRYEYERAYGIGRSDGIDWKPEIISCV